MDDLTGDDLVRRASKSSAPSESLSEDSLTVNTTEAHVRAAHESYSRTVPDLCGPLKEGETSVSFLLFIPVLGQVLTYRAVVLGGAA